MVVALCSQGDQPCAGVVLDGTVYFFIRYQGMRWLVPGRCFHRGGPLHLGEERDDVVRCPWHGQPTRKSNLIRKAVPFVRAGSRLFLACPGQVGAWWTWVRHGSAGLQRPGP